MTIRPILRVQFDALKLPYNRRAPGARDREAGWYADAAREVVGVIFADEDESRWSYLVCARESRGRFQVIGQGMDYNHLGRVEQDLIEAMERHLAMIEPEEPVAVGGDAEPWQRLRVFA